jgi:hypothetical protein
MLLIRRRLRTPLVVAAVSCLAGSAGVLLLTRSTPIGVIIVVTLLFGITLGTASGPFRTWGYIGSIASSAIIAITFRTSVSDHGLHVIGVIMITGSGADTISTRRSSGVNPRDRSAASWCVRADRLLCTTFRPASVGDMTVRRPSSGSGLRSTRPRRTSPFSVAPMPRGVICSARASALGVAGPLRSGKTGANRAFYRPPSRSRSAWV